MRSFEHMTSNLGHVGHVADNGYTSIGQTLGGGIYKRPTSFVPVNKLRRTTDKSKCKHTHHSSFCSRSWYLWACKRRISHWFGRATSSKIWPHYDGSTLSKYVQRTTLEDSLSDARVPEYVDLLVSQRTGDEFVGKDVHRSTSLVTLTSVHLSIYFHGWDIKGDEPCYLRMWCTYRTLAGGRGNIVKPLIIQPWGCNKSTPVFSKAN